MTMKVLVPVEDTFYAAYIVDFIRRHHWEKETWFHVVHVAEPSNFELWPGVMFGPIIESLNECDFESANHLVKLVGEAIRKTTRHAVVTQQVVEAPTLEGILHCATTFKPNMVIVGSHGRSGHKHVGSGSISLALAAELSMPLVVVKPDKQSVQRWDRLDDPPMGDETFEGKLEELYRFTQLKKIIIPVDASPLSDQVVEFCVKHEWPAQCEFKIIAAEDSNPWLSKSANDEAIRRRRDKSLNLANEMQTSLPTHCVSSNFEKGSAKEAILKFADDWQANLIVIGCHSRSRVHRFLLGSVAMSALCAAPCSVLILKEQLQSPSSTNEQTLETTAK